MKGKEQGSFLVILRLGVAKNLEQIYLILLLPRLRLYGVNCIMCLGFLHYRVGMLGIMRS